jgi:uncharacterized protein (TIGR03437 family)
MTSLKCVLSCVIALLLFALLYSADDSVAAEIPEKPLPPAQSLISSDKDAEGRSFMIEADQAGQAACRVASAEEDRRLRHYDPRLTLTPIQRSRHRTQGQTAAAAGMKIILRATSQLDGFPEAKAAFVRAAAFWEARIQNPITIVVDVDYGPTFFGGSYNSNTLGSTSTQTTFKSYNGTRSKMIESASGATETALYNSLTTGSAATDVGSVTIMNGTTPQFRAIGMLSATEDPATEATLLGSPSRIGFNSAFTFDFDPGNGIDSGKIDFEAVALHEIGHVLGFVSRVGATETNPGASIRLTLFDLFRFRPGVTTATFPSALRILSSGGDQVFFAGGGSIPLSTGRGDGTGGDERQASHWKDNLLNGGLYAGIMDPTSSGRRETVTENDLLALDAMGYQVNLNEPLPMYSDVPASVWGGSAATGQCAMPAMQYAIDVPADAQALSLRLATAGPTPINARLLARFNQSVTEQSGNFTFDHASAGGGGFQTLSITPQSSPPLRAGRYYIAVSNCSTTPASLTLTPTVTLPPKVATSVSAASFQTGSQASESIVAAFGANLATQTVVATTLPLPVTLAGTTVLVRDSQSRQRNAFLFFVSPNQVNYQIPSGLAPGPATVTITSGDNTISVGNIEITAVSPALFSASSSGQGVASALVLRARPDNTQVYESVATYDSAQQKFVAAPIDLGPAGDQLFLILFGTGIRGRSNLSATGCTIGGVAAEALYAGQQGGFVGLDQVNVRIPRSLAGRGEMDVVLRVDGVTANTVRISVK